MRRRTTRWTRRRPRRTPWPELLLLGAILATLAPPAGAGAPRPSDQGLLLTALPGQGVTPLLVRFYLTVPTGPSPALSWDFGDGHFLNGTAPTDDSPAHTYDVAGTYRCIVTATWSTGSVNTSTSIVVRPSNLTVTAASSPSNGTYPLTVWLNATVHGGTGTYVSFYWAFGDGNQGSGLSVEYTYASPGKFRANFTATDSNGRSATATTTVSVLAPSGDRPSGGGGWGSLTGVLVALPIALGGLGALIVYWWARRFPATRVPPTASAPAVPLPGPTGFDGPSGGVPGPPQSPGAGSGGADRPVAIEGSAWAAASVPLALSTPTRITDALIRHLAGLPTLYPSDVPTKSWTQAGIAEGIGAGQSAVSRVLRRLIAAGVVTVETRHVAGSPRRVRIYRLTDRGERLGRALREGGPPPAPGGPAR